MSLIAKLFGRRSKSGTILRTLPAAISLFEPLEERLLLASNPLYEIDLDGRNVSGTTDLGASDYTFQVVVGGDEAVDLSSLDGKDVQVTGPNGFSQLATLIAVNGDSANIPIPSLGQWERDMLSYGAIHGDTSKVYNTWEGFPWYYDGEWAFYQIADYAGNASWNASADHIEETYRTYVLANNGRIPGWRVFPHGLYEDFLRTGDAESKRAVLLLAQNSAFAGQGGGAIFTLSRETAYLIQAYMYAEKLGAPNPKLPVALEFALGHMDQWFVSRTATFIQPFMVGLTAHALIEYDQMYGDERIQPLLEKAADWLWGNAWVEEDQSFYYLSTSPYDPTAKPEVGAPDLNMLIAPIYAWLFKQTGDMKYLERGDAAFAAGVKGAWLGGGKQFVQNYRLSFSYVQWRQAEQSERAAGEQEISGLPASDGSATQTLTYRITTPGGSWDPTDNGPYTVSLMANQVTDAHGNFIPSGALGTFDVAVAEPVPLFTSSETPSGAENTTAVVTLAATNADRPERTVTFSITGGADQSLFQIDGGNQLVFKSAPDYEAPTDADHDNVYLVQVTADDGNGGTTVQSLSVMVTPVNDNNPAFTSSATPSVAENTTAVVTLAATDADLPEQTVTFSIIGGADQSLFQIDGGNQLVFQSAPDYEAPADADHNNAYLVQVTADDGNGGTTVQDLNVTVTNVNEAPTVGTVSKKVRGKGIVTFTSADFAGVFADPDTGDSLQEVKITSLPLHGTLTLGKRPVTLNMGIAVAQLGSLSYKPASGYAGPDSFEWSGSNGSRYAAVRACVNMMIEPLRPTVSAIPKAVAFNAAFTFTASDFARHFGDTNAGDTLHTVKITKLPKRGVLQLNGVTLTKTEWKRREISLSDLDKLTYTPNLGYFRTDRFSWIGGDGIWYARKAALVNLAIS